MRAGPHPGVGIAQPAAAHRLAEARVDRQRPGVDDRERLVLGGAQPHLAAAGVDVPIGQLCAHLHAGRDLGGRRVDPRERAVALLLHPHRAFARREEAGLRAQRHGGGDGAGGRIDALQQSALRADRPDRIETERQIPGARRDRDRPDDRVGGGVDPRHHALVVARDPDRSRASDDVQLARRIGDAGGDRRDDRRGARVDAGYRALLAIGDPQRVRSERHRAARPPHRHFGTLSG